MNPEIITLLKHDLVRAFAEKWGRPAKIHLIDAVENFVYDVAIEGIRRILRITHSTHRSETDISAELDWVRYLHANDMRVCTPLLSTSGRFTEVMPVNDSYFTACVFERAPGSPAVDIDYNDWGDIFIQNWGETVSRMHALTKKYDSHDLTQKRNAWQPDDLIEEARQYMPPKWRHIICEIEQLLTHIRAMPKNKDTFGLIHDDLNPTNFFVQNNEITVFDFDDCCYNWFVSDIATAIPYYSKMFRRDDWRVQFIKFFRLFIDGYKKKNCLKPEMLAYVGDYLRLNNINSVIFSFEIDSDNRKRYDAWFSQVLHFYEHGHPLNDFDFLSALDDSDDTIPC
jgi:Ser/Thr protein kinase RdoA (MazF antagonist)